MIVVMESVRMRMILMRVIVSAYQVNGGEYESWCDLIYESKYAFLLNIFRLYIYVKNEAINNC